MKTALVTGGSRGIGKAIALQLGKSFNVGVGYSSSKDSGDKVVAEIINSGGTASPVEIDVTNIESIKNAFISLEHPPPPITAFGISVAVNKTSPSAYALSSVNVVV